jgi:hypothetical protein
MYAHRFANRYRYITKKYKVDDDENNVKIENVDGSDDDSDIESDVEKYGLMYVDRGVSWYKILYDFLTFKSLLSWHWDANSGCNNHDNEYTHSYGVCFEIFLFQSCQKNCCKYCIRNDD